MSSSIFGVNAICRKLTLRDMIFQQSGAVASSNIYTSLKLKEEEERVDSGDRCCNSDPAVRL